VDPTPLLETIFTSVFTNTKNVINHFHFIFWLKSKNTRTTQGLYCCLEKCVLLSKYFLFSLWHNCCTSRHGYGIFVHYRSYVIIQTPQTYDLMWTMFRSFSPNLWIVVGVAMTLLSVSLAAIQYTVRKHGLQDGGDYTLRTFIFIVFGAYCQEGNMKKR